MSVRTARCCKGGDFAGARRTEEGGFRSVRFLTLFKTLSWGFFHPHLQSYIWSPGLKYHQQLGGYESVHP